MLKVDKIMDVACGNNFTLLLCREEGYSVLYLAGKDDQKIALREGNQVVKK